MAHYIDLESWPRKPHFDYFSAFDYPHFNVCANVDITHFSHYLKENSHPFFISFLFAASKAANLIPELRYRIKNGAVLVHESVSPSFTVLANNGLFGFCTAAYCDDFAAFKTAASSGIEAACNCTSIADDPDRDDLLFVTSLPWVSFTSIVMPIQMHPVDSVPRLSWGKFFEQEKRTLIPFSLQAHHALVDGVHVGAYFKELQDILDHPEKNLG